MVGALGFGCFCAWVSITTSYSCMHVRVLYIGAKKNTFRFYTCNKTHQGSPNSVISSFLRRPPSQPDEERGVRGR